MRTISLIIVIFFSFATGCGTIQPLDGEVMLSPTDVATLNQPTIPNLIAQSCSDGARIELRTLIHKIKSETGPRGRIGSIETVCRISTHVCNDGIFEREGTRDEILTACND